MCEVCAGYSTYNCPVCGEQARMITCPDCKGTGEGDWKVYDILEDVVLTVPKDVYDWAADDEETANLLNQRFCRESCICPTCKGKGEIPEISIGYNKKP